MVFYMIMPAIFGAFGNFLLPTQLGVHDVAFPRLNSAAFWFLPGGLIMLCQLVCTDRRYARMNCFNIRELQGILKRRFFTDLVNSHDHKELLTSTMIGVKYKLNNTTNGSLDTTLFYNLGIFNENMSRTGYYLNTVDSTTRAYLMPTDFFILSFLRNSLDLSYFLRTLTCCFINFFSLLPTPSTVFSSLQFFSADLLSGSLFKIVYNVIAVNSASLSIFISQLTSPVFPLNEEPSLLFFSKNLSTKDSINNFSFTEHSSSQRSTRFSNALIGYDYKTGHYLGSSEALYPQLVLSFIEVARGIRKPS